MEVPDESKRQFLSRHFEPATTEDQMTNRSTTTLANQRGQGLVEYTLIVFLIAFVLWVAMKGTGVGEALATNWNTIYDCLSAPFTGCSSGS